MSEGETRSRESGESGEDESRRGGRVEGGSGSERRAGNRDLLQKHDSMCSVLAVSLKAADPLAFAWRKFARAARFSQKDSESDSSCAKKKK